MPPNMQVVTGNHTVYSRHRTCNRTRKVRSLAYKSRAYGRVVSLSENGVPANLMIFDGWSQLSLLNCSFLGICCIAHMQRHIHVYPCFRMINPRISTVCAAWPQDFVAAMQGTASKCGDEDQVPWQRIPTKDVAGNEYTHPKGLSFFLCLKLCVMMCYVFQVVAM